MSYIPTVHSVGGIVYAYDAATDSVRRLVVSSVIAHSSNATLYGGEWFVTYNAKPLDNSSTPRGYAASELHESPRSAFPPIALEAIAQQVAEVTA